MKKIVVLLVCAVIVLVGYVLLYKSGIESSFGANKAYKQGIAFHKNKEYDKAFELYKKACDGGEMRGCTNLGVMYANGFGGEKNEQKAVELYKKACDDGEMLGCYNLGVMYAKGNGVEKDFSKAVQLFKKACDGGDMNGCRNLDNIYKLDVKAVEKTR